VANRDQDKAFKAMLVRRIESDRHLESQIQARLAELTAEKESVVRRRSAAEDLYEAEFGERLTEVPGRAATEERPAVQVGPLTGLSWSAGMMRVLQDAGRPLHVTEIWDELQAGGFRTGSRDPVRSVVAIAVRGASFVKAGPNRYALATATAEAG
jgi:hypothetical protein